MCRWITVLSSERVSLSDIVLTPSNSLVQLAKDASFHPGYGDENNHVMNGDGFGVGWYHTNHAVLPNVVANGVTATPILAKNKNTRLAAVFKDTQPAWNCLNLRELCLATSSDCIIAHVRAASKFTGISQANCHPFKAGRLLFCHNGRIDSFPRIRRAMMDRLTEEAFLSVRGTTDSECIFALMLTFMSKDGEADQLSPFSQTEPFGHKRMVAAIKKTIRAIEILLQEEGLTDIYNTFNFSLTDGDTVCTTRFCDKNPIVAPPSLYFAYGTAATLYAELTSEDPVAYVTQHSASDTEPTTDSEAEGDTSDSEALVEKNVVLHHHESRPGKLMQEVNPATACCIVASNPLTRTHTWHKLPANSILWCTRGSLPELRLLRTRAATGSIVVTTKY